MNIYKVFNAFIFINYFANRLVGYLQEPVDLSLRPARVKTYDIFDRTAVEDKINTVTHLGDDDPRYAGDVITVDKSTVVGFVSKLFENLGSLEGGQYLSLIFSKDFKIKVINSGNKIHAASMTPETNVLRLEQPIFSQPTSWINAIIRHELRHGIDGLGTKLQYRPTLTYEDLNWFAAPLQIVTPAGKEDIFETEFKTVLSLFNTISSELAESAKKLHGDVLSAIYDELDYETFERLTKEFRNTDSYRTSYRIPLATYQQRGASSNTLYSLKDKSPVEISKLFHDNGDVLQLEENLYLTGMFYDGNIKLTIEFPLENAADFYFSLLGINHNLIYNSLQGYRSEIRPIEFEPHRLQYNIPDEVSYVLFKKTSEVLQAHIKELSDLCTKLIDGHEAELLAHKRFGELVEVDALLKAIKNTPSPDPDKPPLTAVSLRKKYR